MKRLDVALFLICMPFLPLAGESTYPAHVNSEESRQAWDQGWPQWRGPDGNGHTPTLNLTIKEYVLYPSKKSLDCLDAKTGEVLWSMPNVLGGNSIAVVGDELYCFVEASFKNAAPTCYRLTLEEPVKVWQWDKTGEGSDLAAPVIHGKYAYMKMDKIMHMIDRKSGESLGASKKFAFGFQSIGVDGNLLVFHSNSFSLVRNDEPEHFGFISTYHSSSKKGLPDYLGKQTSGAYVCGLLFLRGKYLSCLDLRQGP